MSCTSLTRNLSKSW